MTGKSRIRSRLETGCGITVDVPWYADVPPRFLPGGDNWPMLSEVLSQVEADEIENGDIVTFDGLAQWTLRAVLPNDEFGLESYQRGIQSFAVHAGHRARKPQLSPFLAIRGTWPETNSLTVMFDKGALVRVIPGDYSPPLPWMTSAREDGVDECERFWREHSYLRTPHNFIVGTETTYAPAWWRQGRIDD